MTTLKITLLKKVTKLYNQTFSHTFSANPKILLAFAEFQT